MLYAVKNVDHRVDAVSRDAPRIIRARDVTRACLVILGVYCNIKMASAQYGLVCSNCLQRSSTSENLLANGCNFPEKHGGSRKMKAWWWEAKGHLEIFYPEYPFSVPPVRPVPHAGSRYILCHRNSQCKRGNCTYAHSIEERDTWNGATSAMKGIDLATSIIIHG